MSDILTITDDVKWVGIKDKDIVTFDIVMETQYGTTYNSYFIDADKKAVIDTSKETFKEDYLDKLRSLTDLKEIEVIVVNHTEPDHSGNLKNLLVEAPNATVYGSRQAITYLKDITNIDFPAVMVKDGDTLSLGNKTLRFISAPNLHWPDSMYTYLEEDKLLFTCDSFGAHFCGDEMFDDQIGNYTDSFIYYFDVILKPFSNFMLKAINKIEDLDIYAICPGHGPILRSTWKEKVALSKKLSSEYLETLSDDKTILITYVSAYGYTKQMAETIANGIKQAGDYNIKLLDIETAPLGSIEEAITQSKGILIGSPTINKNTLLPVYQMFALINPIRDRGKKAGVFGSYGWSGEAVQIIESNLKQLHIEIAKENLRLKFHPGDDKTAILEEYGKNFAETL